MAGYAHLHVASGYSARYGASHPEQLVRAAAERGMDTLALTDRDTVTGSVRFAHYGGARGPLWSPVQMSQSTPGQKALTHFKIPQQRPASPTSVDRTARRGGADRAARADVRAGPGFGRGA
jgi:hypothetical protein